MERCWLLPSALSKVPCNKRYHIVGIGGIGMSAIAAVMHESGYMVSGSDAKMTERTSALQDSGIVVNIGHGVANILSGVDYIIRSTAVTDDNPEIVAARRFGIPVISRASFLSNLVSDSYTICISGSHGKTTMTSLLGHIAVSCGVNPSVISGGIVKNWGSNARLGRGGWFIIEADESDRTFMHLPRTVAVVTSIDNDHTDVLGSLDQSVKLFNEFVSGTPFYGIALLCLDDKNVEEMIGSLSEDVLSRCYTYSSVNQRADFYACNIIHGAGRIHFDLADTRGGASNFVRGLCAPMIGDHNLGIAVASMALCLFLGCSQDLSRKGLAEFAGVGRRMELIGNASDGVRFYDDYAHHPTEISAVVSAAKIAYPGSRVIAVVQPHRFSRLDATFDQFVDALSKADLSIILDVFSAGEEKGDVDSATLCEASGLDSVVLMNDSDEIAVSIRNAVSPGDIVLFMGAGDITEIAREVYSAFVRGGA